MLDDVQCEAIQNDAVIWNIKFKHFNDIRTRDQTIEYHHYYPALLDKFQLPWQRESLISILTVSSHCGCILHPLEINERRDEGEYVERSSKSYEMEKSRMCLR